MCHISMPKLQIYWVCRLHTAFLHWPLSSAATKEVQGPDTTWRRIQGPLPWSWRESMDAICTLCPGSQNQVIPEIEAWASPPPPPPEQPGQNPLPPPFRYTPLPQPEYQWRPASEKTHFGLGYKVRGHGLSKRRMRRSLWAFQQLSRTSGSWASD